MAKGKYHEWLEPDRLNLLKGWAREGLTDEQIAAKMHINVATLYNWKNKYCEIFEALKENKEQVDKKVEQALLNNALGIESIEETSERQFNKKTGQYEMVVTKRVIKTGKADTTAQIFWLKNRAPQLWRDKVEAEHNVNFNTSSKLAEVISQLTEEGGECLDE